MSRISNAFDEIDNPEAAKKREEILAEPDLPWVKYSENYDAWSDHIEQSRSKIRRDKNKK